MTERERAIYEAKCEALKRGRQAQADFREKARAYGEQFVEAHHRARLGLDTKPIAEINNQDSLDYGAIEGKATER